jgi:hypothetical protein
VLSPKDSPLGKLLRQYVTVRIIRMDTIDIGLFEHDRNNTIYFYILNGDEQIYMRYGGRDNASPDTYLNLESLTLAAAKGLELHANRPPAPPRPRPDFPKNYPLLVERTFARNQCVECHLIGDYQNLHRQQDGTLDKLVHLYRSPDLKTVGILLDVPKGLVLKEATGAAAAAGLQPGDRIAKWEGTVVWTFADVQHRYNETPRKAKEAKLTVERGGKMVDITMALPPQWWWAETKFRQSSVEPRFYFDDRPLTAAEKQELGLPVEGFASRVKYVSSIARTMELHALQEGDVIAGIDGKRVDPDAHTGSLYLILRKSPGESAMLEVLRGGKKMEMPLKTIQMSFRK